MKKHLLTILFSGVCLVCSIAQNTSEVALDYLKLYTTMNFDEIGKYYNDESVFDDATMSFFGQGREYATRTGGDSIVSFLREGFSKISAIEYKVEKSYSVGVIHFSYGVLSYTYSPEIEGEIRSLSIKLPLAIILEVKDGKIIRHQDVADYVEWYKQYQKQLKG